MKTFGESTVRQKVKVMTFAGECDFYSFDHLIDPKEHIALAFGDIDLDQPVLVRIHSECLTGDVFSSGRCDCGEQLKEAMKKMAATQGVLLYLRQEGRGIGLYNKLDAYALQDQGHDTFQANRLLGLPDDMRNYTVAAQMLSAMGISTIKLLTNNPEKALQMKTLGVGVSEVVPTQLHLKSDNLLYLQAKAQHGHTLDLKKLTKESSLLEFLNV